MSPDIARLSLEQEQQQQQSLPSSRTTLTKLPGVQYAGRISARDITKEFTAASRELRQGQLIKDDFFTLFESVGALEIMDPKMDSGFMMPEADAIVDNFDPLKSILPAEIVGIMDQMLCLELAWHEGYPLSQTLFTSLHIYSLLSPFNRPLSEVVFRSKQWTAQGNVDPLISVVLRAYCMGILKCCDSVICEVLGEHFYEEEDFVTQTFGQNLLSDIGDASIISLLKDSIGTLQQLDLPGEVKTAIKARLELRAHMLEALQYGKTNDIGSRAEPWRAALQASSAVNDTVSTGIAVPGAFSERVQRHLASNTPPRSMIVTSWQETYPKLKQLCEDSIEVYRITSLDQPSPFSIMRFAWDFASRSPQPSTYPRAIIQSLLFKDGAFLSTVPHQTLLLTDVRELVLAGDSLLSPTNWEVESSTDPRHLSALKIDDFVSKSLDEYLNIYRMTLQNRCRMRRTFAQSIAILDSLQAEAEFLDADLHAINNSAPYHFAGGMEPLQFYPLAAWVYFHKLLIMEWMLGLGFEMDVYLPDELAGMYKLVEHVSATRAEHLSHIDFFANLRLQRLERSGKSGDAEECRRSRAFIRILVAQARSTAALAGALSSLYALLSPLNLLPTPPRSYSTPALRHELRLKPFLPCGTPSLPSAADLASSTTFPASTTIISICETIDSHLKTAKTAFATLKTAGAREGGFVGCEGAWGKEVQGAIRSCIATSVAAAGIRGVCGKVGVVKVGDVEKTEGLETVECRIPEVGERYHGWWVVPKIGEKKG